jgi:hypothetical protein
MPFSRRSTQPTFIVFSIVPTQVWLVSPSPYVQPLKKPLKEILGSGISGGSKVDIRKVGAPQVTIGVGPVDEDGGGLLGVAVGTPQLSFNQRIKSISASKAVKLEAQDS